jgi:hypothetical protein
MPRHLCQVPTVESARIVSLCDDCSHREGCADAYALKLIAEGDGEYELKIHLVAECDRHVPDVGSFAGRRGHLGPQLFVAGVRDLCEGCPDGKRSLCGHRRRLDGLTRVSVARGGWLKPIVVACGASHKGAGCQKLHRINEPAR